VSLDRKKEDLLGHYTVKKLSPFRRITIDSLDVLTPIHNMLALLEVDITEAREKIRKGIREGRPVSLQAFIIKSIASAVEANKELNSFLVKKRIYTFDDVDINIPLELNREGVMFPGQVVIRRTSGKSVEDIYREIKEAKNRFLQQEVTGVEDEWALRLMRILFIFPAFVRKFILRKIISNPRLVKEKHGTIHFTSIAGFGQSSGFVIPCMGDFRAVDFTLGSIVKKPVGRGKEISLREVLTMTVMFNYDIVDGAPAARFTNRLRSIFEKAEELWRGFNYYGSTLRCPGSGREYYRDAEVGGNEPMSMQIFYFSGTGNSLHAAREIQKRLAGSTLVPIVGALKKNDIKTTAETMVFPGDGL